MSGVLFIVTIPTEKEEQRIDPKNEKVPSSLPQINCPSDRLSVPVQATNLRQTKVNECDNESLNNLKLNFDPKEFNLKSELNIDSNSSMELILHELLKKFEVENAVWNLSKNTNFFQVTFFVESNKYHELMLVALDEWGIGQKNGSCVSMIPCAIFKQSTNPTNEFTAKSPPESQEVQTSWNKFISSIHARLNVAQIVQKVRADATLTFDFLILIIVDFLILIIVAGILAAFGLVENDTTMLAASMLVCPLMGPIIATIFGIVIKDRSLIRFGMLNELIGILLATLFGFLFGLITFSMNDKFVHGSQTPLTREMVARCEFDSITLGIFVALPSGAAATIAILGENYNSLAGVAISASLLPPAVNSGLLWSLSVLYALHEDNVALFGNLINTTLYSEHQSVELAVYGSISMLLTVVNVICILFMGVLILKIKEVAPMATKKQKQLWKHDVKVARDYNTQAFQQNDDPMQRQFVDELTEIQNGEEPLGNVYRNSQQSTANQPGSYINDLETICSYTGIPTSNQLRPPTTYNRSQSLFANIEDRRSSYFNTNGLLNAISQNSMHSQAISNIFEISLPSISQNENSNNTASASNVKKPRIFIVK